jgi:hypothetical protein
VLLVRFREQYGFSQGGRRGEATLDSTGKMQISCWRWGRYEAVSMMYVLTRRAATQDITSNPNQQRQRKPPSTIDRSSTHTQCDESQFSPSERRMARPTCISPCTSGSYAPAASEKKATNFQKLHSTNHWRGRSASPLITAYKQL